MKSEIIKQDNVVELQNALNEWLEKNKNIQIISLTPYTVMLHDFMNYNPNEIANQWYEYTVIILYEEI